MAFLLSTYASMACGVHCTCFVCMFLAPDGTAAASYSQSHNRNSQLACFHCGSQCPATTSPDVRWFLVPCLRVYYPLVKVAPAVAYMRSPTLSGYLRKTEPDPWLWGLKRMFSFGPQSKNESEQVDLHLVISIIPLLSLLQCGSESMHYCHGTVAV